MKNTRLNVTQPFLPPLNEFQPYLEQIWENKRLTNRGPFHDQLEEELCSYLGVRHISLFCNGTIALLVAIKALELSGEIITTPYSFVATAHSIKWNGIKPVFVDIESKTCNINPDKIEQAITPNTSAIMPVHVYGNPCDNDSIQEIANKHNIKIIYDAAHAFGVNSGNQSIMNWGDLSVLSFHATKIFNTFEGGAIICHSYEMKRKIDDLKNFGFQSEVTIKGLGINGKMSEVQAAMGLLQLKYIDQNIADRKKITVRYKEYLSNIPGLTYLDENDNNDYNHSYFPIFIDENIYREPRDCVYKKLKQKNIYGRRYFYPLISEFEEYNRQASSSIQNHSMAKYLSDSVICLPIYPGLKDCELKLIVDVIKGPK
jgi:dTDP-4-amino-4,6-dideoxygalactose transaminase